MSPGLKENGAGLRKNENIFDLTSKNINVVLCMSPVGDSLRKRCRDFPSLINCCTVYWYDLKCGYI